MSVLTDMLGAMLEEGLTAFTLAPLQAETSDREYRLVRKLRRSMIRVSAFGVLTALISWVLAATVLEPSLAGNAAKVGYVALAVGLLALLFWAVSFGSQRPGRGGRGRREGGA